MSHETLARRRSALPPLLRLAGWLLVLLAAFATVVWRQTRGVALQRELRAIEADQGIAEARRLELVGRMHALGSRSRIVRVAGERLGMQLPDDRDIVLVPLAAPETGASAQPVGAP
ncbi:MAG: cell division protein FtsL [Gemmatimonadota bacterium]|nr:cell division protein FtsL [Gemmatimonadota bacterium]